MNAEGLVCIAVTNEHLVGVAKLDREEVIAAAHSCKVAAGDDSAVFVDNADNSVYGVLHLMNNTLEQSVRHYVYLFLNVVGKACPPPPPMERPLWVGKADSMSLRRVLWFMFCVRCAFFTSVSPKNDIAVAWGLIP